MSGPLSGLRVVELATAALVTRATTGRAETRDEMPAALVGDDGL